MVFRKKIKPRHLSLFYRRMSSMTATGMTVSEAISAIAEVGGKTAMGKQLSDINARISNGESAGVVLVESFRHLADIPSEVIDGDGKEVSAAFSAIAEHIDRELIIRDSFNNITAYPATVSILLLLILSVISVFVIPVFSEMYAALGGALPLPTRIVVALSDKIIFIVLGIIAAVVFFYKSRNLLFLLMDKVPLLGRATRNVAAAEFMSTYTTLMNLDISPEHMLRASLGSINNAYLSIKLKQMTEGVESLEDVLEHMKSAKFLPDIVVQMLKASKRTGTVESGFKESAEMLFDEMEIFNKRFFAFATPFMVLLLGSAAGFVIISLYMPIFGIFMHIG